MTPKRSVVMIVGPTASGKSRVAIELALRLGGEIVSADSRLLYRGLDIGTDKPSLGQRNRVPHHLIDVADPRETWSLARYCGAAAAAIEAILTRGSLPIVVGGTGQYVRALLQGWSLVPGAMDPEVRDGWQQVADRLGSDALYAMLAETDPASATRIDPRNVRRVIRALEIHQITGVPASRQRRRASVPFRYLVFGLSLPREELYRRLDARLDVMLRQGLVAEVEQLLAAGVPPDAPSLSAIGYAQIVRHVQGACSLEEAVAEVRRQTRSLVRHQANWFRPDDPNIQWFLSRDGVEVELADSIRAQVSSDRPMRPDPA